MNKKDMIKEIEEYMEKPLEELYMELGKQFMKHREDNPNCKCDDCLDYEKKK